MKRTSELRPEEGKTGLSKHKKKLFKELDESLPVSVKKSSSMVFSFSQGDVIDGDPGMASKWRQLVKTFENLSKYDHKTVVSYLDENNSNIRSKCGAAASFFEQFVKRLSRGDPKCDVSGSLSLSHASSLGAKDEIKTKSLKEDLLKIFVVTFQHVSSTLSTLAIPCTSEAFLPDAKKRLAEALQQMQVLNEFLLLILPCRQNKTTMLQYETVLVLLIRTRISEMQERLSDMAPPLDTSALACTFYYQFEALAMLTSYNASKKFMKDAADEGITNAYEMFERSLVISLSSSLFREIYAALVATNEDWVADPRRPGLFLSTKFGRSKFKYVHHVIQPVAELSPISKGNDQIQFSLGYMNLYYANKIAQLMIEREIFKQEERTMSTLIATLRRNFTMLCDFSKPTMLSRALSPSERARVEVLLNENCVCLKFMKNVLAISNNPLDVMERLSIANLLKSLVSTHLVVALGNAMVGAGPETTDYSFKTHHDCVAKVFKTLYQLKYLKLGLSLTSGNSPVPKAVKKSHFHLILVMDEIVLDILANVSLCLPAIRGKIGALRTLLVEYFSDDKATVSEKQREQLLKLFEGPIFKFTAPEDFQPEKSPPDPTKDFLNAKALQRLIQAISRVTRQDRKWAFAAVQSLTGQILRSPSEPTTFGLLKLLYGILTGEAYDDSRFYLILYASPALPLDRAEVLCPSIRKDVVSMGCIQEMIESRGFMAILDAVIGRYKEKDVKERNFSILERAVLLLLNLPLMCEHLLKNRRDVEELLELAVAQRQCNKFGISVLQRCLASIKYGPELRPNESYLPQLLVSLVHGKLSLVPTNPLAKELCFPIYDLLIKFLEFDPEAQSLPGYQNMLFQNNSWLLLLKLLMSHETAEDSGPFLLRLLEYIKGMVSHNEELKKNMHETPTIAKRIITREIVRMTRSKILSPEVIRKVLNRLLEIAFETPIELGVSANHFIIKHGHFFGICLTLMNALAKLGPEWYKTVGEIIKCLIKTIEGSYNNYSSASNQNIFHQLLKLMKKYRHEKQILTGIAQLLAETAIVNISSFSLREFIRKLAYINCPQDDYVEYAETVLDALLKMLKENSHREIFVFNGQSQAGVSVIPIRELPSDGYCFFGWIRVERQDQSYPNCHDSPMCIFRLATKGEGEIKLYLHHGSLFYMIVDIRRREKLNAPLQLTHVPLREDVWYFLELYHLNVAGPENVLFYLDGVEQCRTQYRVYNATTIYNDNSVGCEVIAKPERSEDDATLKYNFRGEMSALHFAAVNSTTQVVTRNVLSKINRVISMHELYPILAFGENRCDNRPRLLSRISYTEMMDAALTDRIFFVINPKYAKKSPPEGEKIYALRQGSRAFVLYNHTEDIYGQAKVHHNYPARDVLINIGGIRCLLPFLHELADVRESIPDIWIRRNKMLTKTLEMVREITVIDKEKASLFYDSDEGIMILRYLLERLANKSGLSREVFDIQCVILETLLKFYPNSAEKYIEMIYLNMDIWKHSSVELQKFITEQIHRMFVLDPSGQFNATSIVNSLLSCVEVYVDKDRQDDQRVQQISGIVLQLAQKHMSTEIILAIISYANIYFLRRLNNYPIQIYHVMLIFMELVTTCRDKMVYVMKDAIKVKRDSKVISTMFSIFDYFTFIKENGFRSEYRGIEHAHPEDSPELVDSSKYQPPHLVADCIMLPMKLPGKQSDAYSIHEEALAQFQGTKEGDMIIDAVVAMAMSWILNFDWGILSEFVKEFGRDEQKHHIGDLVAYLVKTLGKFPIASKSKTQLLYYVFNGNDQRKRDIFGPICYTALMSTVLGIPFKAQGWKELRLQHIYKCVRNKGKLLKQPIVLESLMEHLDLFTAEARREFFKDLAILVSDKRTILELAESSRLIDLTFTLVDYAEIEEPIIKLQHELFCYMLRQPAHSADFARICATMPGPAEHQLKLISTALDVCMEIVATDPGTLLSATLLQISYAIEDALLKDPERCRVYQPFPVISKLLYLLNKMDLMYISLPVISFFDSRAARDIGGLVESDILQGAAVREGGFVRIMLKILPLLLKFDQGEKGCAAVLMHFYLFRDRASKLYIKDTILGLPKSERSTTCSTSVNESGKRKHSSRIKYNLLDLVLRSHPEKIKMHELVSEAFAAKILANSSCLLDSKRVSKGSNPTSGKEKSIFETHVFTLMYLVATFAELIHFQVLGITRYAEFPVEAEFEKKIAGIEREKLMSGKLMSVVKLLEEVVIYIATNEEAAIDPMETIGAELTKMLDLCEDRYVNFLPAHSEVALGVCHNSLSQIYEDKIGKKLTHTRSLSTGAAEDPFEVVPEAKSKAELVKLRTVQQEGFVQFKKLIKGWIFAMVEVIRGMKKQPLLCDKLVLHMLSQSCVKSVQPYLLFITTHNFKTIDALVYNKVNASLSCEPMGTLYNDKPDLQRFARELQEKIYEKFGYISIPKTKMERDELRQEFEGLAGAQYKKLLKEQELEIGAWYNKKLDEQHRKEYAYVNGKYQKLLNRCALYRSLQLKNKHILNPFNEFVKLDVSRDSLSRGQRLRRLKELNEGSVGMTYGYLRHFYLKKLLILGVSQGENAEKLREGEFFEVDFKCQAARLCFLVAATGWNSKPQRLMSRNFDSPIVDAIGVNSPITDYITKIDATVSAFCFPPLQFDECIPKKAKVIEAEMITIKGAIFGKVVVNSICVTFKTEERKYGSKYRLGSTFLNQFSKKVNKKWKLDTIKEIVVKRYNLIRQAAEIYFENSKSVFISFFGEIHLKEFLASLEECIRKKPRNIDIVKRPDVHFAEKKYKERWQRSELSNFEYLMLLNKYGGRSFHDINQYPVFPWILSDYDSDKLQPADPTIYRPLNKTIAAISTVKRRAADEALESMKQHKVPLPFQFDSHYLSGRTVLGYLLRLEPYSSLMTHFVKREEVASRVLHTLRQEWLACNTDKANNKELIPEFFYLPEMFGNYNKCAFGTRGLSCDSPSVRVDQAVLPNWARNQHHFVQCNALALERRYVAFALDAWIDLIFGEKQQDPESYNLFKPLCDEEAVGQMEISAVKQHIAEIQEFGCNPAKLFREKHPPKDKTDYDKRYRYALFTPENTIDISQEPDRSRFAILFVCTFKTGITQIYAYDSRVIVVLSNQKVYRTQDKYLLVPHEKALTFERRDISLFPYKRMFVEGSSHLSCDARRSIISIDQGGYLITCRHYDNSCKIVSTTTGEVLQHLYFHKTLVFTICATKDKKCLFSGSLDGVVAKWNISTYRTQPVSIEWYACDHKLAVISIDALRELDLVASGSLDGTISLRVASTGKFFRLIKPDLHLNNNDYAINQVRLSYRGYIMVLARCKYPKLELSDYYLVYSINGESIAAKAAEDTINAVTLDETGYQFITGGKSGRIYRIDLLSLESHDILEDLDADLPETEKILHHFLSTITAITALDITKQENYQQLLIGLSTGELYTLKYSPRLTSGRLFDNLQGLIISKQNTFHSNL